MEAHEIRHVRPLHDQILVEVARPVEKQLASGIVIPAAAKTDERNSADAIEGVVVAAGRGHMVGDHFVEVLSKVGQRVLFANHSAEKVRVAFDGGAKSDFFRIYDDEVLCLVEGEGEITGISPPSTPHERHAFSHHVRA